MYYTLIEHPISSITPIIKLAIARVIIAIIALAIASLITPIITLAIARAIIDSNHTTSITSCRSNNY